MMLLQRLSEYATQQMGMPPTLYDLVLIAGIIDLDTQHPNKPTFISTINPANRDEKRGVQRLAPQIAKTSGIKPTLFASNAEYTLGLARDTAKPDRVARCHLAYMDILMRCAAATGELRVKAVLDFLSSPDPVGQLDLPVDFDPGGRITFQVDGEFPMDYPSVRRFWAAEHNPATATTKKSTQVGQCLVCGQNRPILDSMQGTIKRVPGGQPSGTLIVSVNREAFESYGLEGGQTSPVCAACGEKFTKALNALIANAQHHIYLGSSVFVFWTREPTTFSLLDTLNTPDTATVKRLLASLTRGEETHGVDANAFYAVSLSGSGGRAVVRDWIDTTIGDVQRHLGNWFDRQRIAGTAGEDPEPIGLFRLAAATVRDGKDLTPQTARALLHAAITGTPLPWDLAAQAIRRNRAERQITPTRAALLKLVLMSQRAIEEGTMVQLNPEHPSVAYHCGRLLAVLEEVQRLAIPGIKATVVDRYFGTASSAPVAVFPRILAGARPHFAKLQRDKPGLHNLLQRRTEEIVGSIPGFPSTLPLVEQGLFSLGYYHQRAHDRAESRAAAERRKAGKASREEQELAVVAEAAFDSTEAN